MKEAARALTGYGIGPDGRFLFREDRHDAGEKTILGRSGAFTGDDFVNILLEQEACPRWVARRLYRTFVADRPEEATPEGGWGRVFDAPALRLEHAQNS